jgi:hypothetical protein
VLNSQNIAVPMHPTAIGKINRGRPNKQRTKAAPSVQKIGLCHASTHST